MIPGRGCFGNVAGDGIVVSAPPPIVGTLVNLFRRKFWASEVMYRGSAADILALQGFCANPGILPQKPQKGDYTHLIDFFRLSSM